MFIMNTKNVIITIIIIIIIILLVQIYNNNKIRSKYNKTNGKLVNDVLIKHIIYYVNNSLEISVNNNHNDKPCTILFYKKDGKHQLDILNDLVDGKDKLSNSTQSYIFDSIKHVNYKYTKIGKLSFKSKNGLYGYMLISDLPLSNLADTITVNNIDYSKNVSATNEIKNKIDVTGKGLYTHNDKKEKHSVFKTILFWITPTGPIPLTVLPEKYIF